MFLGQFHHNLDDKGRLTVPARFRDQLIPEGAYIMQGFDQNLMVFSSSTFEIFSRRVNHMSMTDPTARLLKRLLFSTADFVNIDRAGRILIPQFLREAVHLDSNVIVVGNGDYFEIWTPELWDIQVSELQDAQANAERFSTFDLYTD